MYMDFKLVPGGAFMMCESVAEFDPNVNEMAPEAPGVTEEQNVEAANHAMKEELDKHESYCPLAALGAKLSPLYEEVHNLLTEQLTYEDKEDMVRQLEYVSELATKIANAMRFCLVKTNALHKYMDRDAYYMEPVHEYGGFFLRNATKLQQDGYDVITTTMEWLPEIDLYKVRDLISTCIEMDDLLPTTPTDVLHTVYWSNDPVRFSSTIDFMDCFFNDPERLGRLTKSDSRSFNMTQLTRADHAVQEPCDCFEAKIIHWMATLLRTIKMTCYELQCELMDPNCSLDMGNSLYMSKLHSGVVNLFCIPAVYVIAEAYEIKNGLTAYQSIRDGVKEILAHYGVNPGK